MIYDVVVAGAGPAGFGAAMGAARAGKKVFIFDRNSGPGGVPVYCGCPVFSGMSPFVEGSAAGIGAEFSAAMKEKAFPNPHCKLVSSEFTVGLTMTRMLRAAGVDMLFYVELTDVEREGDELRSVTVTGCGKHITIRGRSFIDCTGDAVLASMAGARCLCGSADETMTKTLLFRVTGVGNYDRELIGRKFAEGGFPFPWQDQFMGTFVGEKGEDFLLNLTAVSGTAQSPEELTRMDMELREQIAAVLEWVRKALPGFENCRLVAVAPIIGVRGGRNIAGREQITTRDLDENTPVTEPVAVGKRSYGDHFVKTFRAPWAGRQGGLRAVPYGALLSADIANLAAGGRGIGVEPRAVSAVRLIPVCIATGQAAGIAAALGFPAYGVLRDELVKQKCRFEPAQ